jgi:hypothetical protein
MPDSNPTPDEGRGLWMAQRAIVTQLLRDDHPECWTRPELEAEIEDIPGQTILAALVYLAIEEVLRVDDGGVWASKCARHLDSLELLSI